ncbi:MAG: DUF4373 domain-containing protein [Prevotellaceae bacterium]|nr:DUF4373 domain-containing protein [Candidatus Minthosoma equi]
MKWFKHSALASREVPIRDIKDKYGYHGLGVFWCIVEDIMMTKGKTTLGELKAKYRGNHFSRVKVESIIRDFGCFKIDSFTYVTVKGNFLDESHDGSHDGSHDIACAFKREEEIRKEKEVVKKNDDDNGGNENDNENQNENQNHNGNRRDGLRMRTKRDWCFNMQAYNGEYREVVCMKSRFSMLLNKRWADAINYFACHLMMIGEIDMFCTETEFKRHFSIFVTNEVTGKALHEAMEALENEERQKSPDFMSTYFGPPLPDDAPPRPSHTAVFDFNFKRWEEPRTPS